jgi:hypothetical protein
MMGRFHASRGVPELFVVVILVIELALVFREHSFPAR